MENKRIYFENEPTNYEVSCDGRVFNIKTQKELKGTYTRNEYKTVQLTINNKPKSFMVHRLVAEYFCENPNHYTIVDHIDRDKLNNNYLNLRWVTNSLKVQNTGQRKVNEKSYYDGDFSEREWKDIQGIYKINSDGTIVNSISKRILKGTLRNGYIRVNLNGTLYSVHRLVWEAFKGDIPENMVIDHIDRNKSNNKIENLRLATQSENMQHAQETHRGKVKVEQYDLKGNYIKTYDSIRAAANVVNGNESAIRQAILRQGSSAGYLWKKG